MLSFSTNLTNEIRDRHSSAYWYIKLYYGDESSFTGLSDQDRILNSVKYRGLVLDWGSIIHSVDLMSFTASTLAMNGLRISNADDKVSGGRFSDLFNTQNYVNRKFTLHMGAVGVAFADHAQIAQGIITDQMTQDFDSLTLSLTQDLSSVSIEVPTNRVDSATYTNAPDNNIGKPIPMSFGDFGLETSIGTIPTSGAEFDRYFVKGRFPAIITDRWNDANARVVATPDSVTMNELDAKNVFYFGEDNYSACEDSNVTETEATPEVTFKGETWRSYFALGKWDTYDTGSYANMIDGVFNATNTLTVTGAPGLTSGFRIPKIPKLGEFISIKFIFDFGAFGGSPPVGSGTPPFRLTSQPGANHYAIAWDTGDKSVAVTSEYTTAQQDAWDLEGNFQLVIDDTGGTNYNQSVVVNQVGIEIEFTPSQNFVKEYFVERETQYRERGSYGQDTTLRMTVDRRKFITPEVSDYIYFSGKGREYGGWIDTIDSKARATYTGGTDPGYASGALIKNPVYMIEEILRTEVGLDPSETGIDIDVASFDVAGADATGGAGEGKIGKTVAAGQKGVFNISVSAIEFSFSQYQFINAWDLCQELATSCGCLLFFSGDGKVKIKARQRDEDYTTADKTINYNEIDNIKPGITPLGEVRNKVSVNYNMDYAQDVLSDTTTERNDTTSQGSGVNGINKTQELIYDNRFILSQTSAGSYADALLDWLAYRKKKLSFDVITPKHNALEIGDTLKFEDWPTTFKIYGNTITATDIYMITKIQKHPNGCSITCQEVSEVTD